MELSSTEAEKLGKSVIELLGLTLKHGRVKTSGGSKTPMGLGRTILRLVEEETVLEDCIPFRVDVKLNLDDRTLERMTKRRLQEAVSKIANPDRSDEGALEATVR